MAGLCKIQIIGNVGGDPELRYNQAGNPRTTFSVACNRFRKGPDGEQIKETEWFRVTAFGRLAEVSSELLSRGRRVYVEGRFSSRVWQGQDGEKRTSLEIVATDLVVLDPRPQATVGAEAAPTGTTDDQSEFEDLPF